MAELGQIVEKIRSKNAGPFWLTIDIFCGTDHAFKTVKSSLPTQQIANLLKCSESEIKRFDIAELNVVKFSLPRPTVQGSIHDRDMHGASFAALISELNV